MFKEPTIKSLDSFLDPSFHAYYPLSSKRSVFFSFFRLSDHLSVFRKACNEQKKVLLPIHFCENLGV